MSWIIRPGHEHDFIDGRTHVHHVHLLNRITGGELNVELLLGAPTCRECKRPFAQSDLSLLDPKSEIEQIMVTLDQNHEAVMAYMRRHGKPIRLGPLAEEAAQDGHRILSTGGHRLLVPARVSG